MLKYIVTYTMFIVTFCWAHYAFAQEEMIVKGHLVEIDGEVYHIEQDDGAMLELLFDFQSVFYMDRKETNVTELNRYVLPIPVTVYYYYLDGAYYVDTLFASSDLGKIDVD